MQDLKKVKDVHDGLRYMRSGIAALLRLGLRYEVDLKKWEVVVKIPKYIPPVFKLDVSAVCVLN